MTTKAGLWIDHRKAIIVYMTDAGNEVKTIKSDVEPHVRAAGGSRSSTPYGPQDIAAGDSRDRRIDQHLNRYYREVIESLEDAESVFIMGPGEAKGEFQKQIKTKKFRQKIAGVETADKMTERQLVAKVKKQFATLSQV